MFFKNDNCYFMFIYLIILHISFYFLETETDI